jgi:prepilin-type processing-associated H-X9-DG protein
MHFGTKLGQFSDGVSNTILLSETWGFEPYHDRGPTPTFGCGGPALPGHIDLSKLCNGRGLWISALTKFDVAGINGRRGPQYEGRVDRWYTAASFHPGGTHMVMADGSVHFISETIDWRTLNDLATRDGDEPTSVPVP